MVQVAGGVVQHVALFLYKSQAVIPGHALTPSMVQNVLVWWVHLVGNTRAVIEESFLSSLI